MTIDALPDATGNEVDPRGTLLMARSVMAGHHGHPIVHDLDLEVRPGEVVALLGPNGAGKTTTLRTLSGELPLLGGTVWFNGSVTKESLHRRARKGLSCVSDNRSIFMKLSTLDNLRVGRVDVKRALELFPQLGPLLKRTAGQLSGGEQQMLTLARALARRPKLLLADELSLGLAPLVVTHLLETVRRVANDDGMGVLLVEQHVNQALRYADRVYAMRRGAIVLSGSAAEVGPRLQEAYLSET